MFGAAATSNLLTRRPSAPVCLVTSTLPSMFFAASKTSSAVLTNFDAAFVAALESAFAASAGMDHRFDDEQFGAVGEKFFGDGFCSLGRVADVAGGNGDAVLGQQLSGLIFVNIHLESFVFWVSSSWSGNPRIYVGRRVASREFGGGWVQPFQGSMCFFMVTRVARPASNPGLNDRTPLGFCHASISSNFIIVAI